MKTYLKNSLKILALLAVLGIPMMVGCSDSDDGGGSDGNELIGTTSEYLPLSQTVGQALKFYYKASIVDSAYTGTSASDPNLVKAERLKVTDMPVELDFTKDNAGKYLVDGVTSLGSGSFATIEIGTDGSYIIDVDDNYAPVGWKFLNKELRVGDKFTYTNSRGTFQIKVVSSLSSYTNTGGTYPNVAKLSFTYMQSSTKTWQGVTSVALATTSQQNPLGVPATYTRNRTDKAEVTVYLAKTEGIVGMESFRRDYKDVKTKVVGTAQPVADTYFHQVSLGSAYKTTSP